jgi:[ribosomal protein S5]-alanine N-acetyltransferase
MTNDALQSRFLVGARIYLREVRVADVGERYYAWMNDPEITRYLESRFFPQPLEGIEAYVRARSGDRAGVFLAIVLRDGDRHIGNIKLGPVDWIHRLADIGLVIGEKDCWGKGYATEAIRLVTDYAFRMLNLHKVTAGCYATNLGSAQAFQKVGFAIEGVRPRHFYSEGEYVDHILLGRINPAWKPQSPTAEQP